MSGIIGVCSPSFCKSEKLKNQLSAEFTDWTINYCQEQVELATNQLLKFLADTEIAIVGKERIDKDLLAKLPKLKAIAKYGVGLDSIDLDACERQGIRVFHRPGVNRHAVAEITIGMMISVLRNINKSDRLLKQGVWHKDGGQQLWGKTVGIIGCGAVGSEVARLLKAFDCRILICDILSKAELCNELGAEQRDLHDVLCRSKVVSLHVPLTETTAHLINKSALESMGSDSILINTSRGGVVDQSKLKAALQKRTILAAAIDVYEAEPCRDQELLSLDNLLATSHIAGNARESVQAMGAAAIAGVRDFVLSQY